MSLRPLCPLLLAIGAGCVPDPEIKVPDFSVPPLGADMALGPADLSQGQGVDQGAAMWVVSKAGTANLRALWTADPGLGTVYVVGHEGTILRRAGNGEFLAETSGTMENLYAVVGLSAEDVYAVGAKGTILHRKNSKWEKEIVVGLTTSLLGLAIGAPGEVYAVGDGGTILHMSGGMWKAEVSGTMANLRAAWGSAQEVYAVGAQGAVLRRTMDKWAMDTAVVQAADRQNLLALGSLDGVIYAAGEYGTVLKRAADKWTAEATVKPPMMMGMPPHFFGLYGGGGDLIAVGAGGALQRRGAMGTWVEEKTGTTEDLSGVTGGGARAVLAVGNKGTVLRRQ